jgi:hypothetical protein
MVKIVIQSNSCETIINNVHLEDLDFWEEMLRDAMQRGEVQVIELTTNQHQAA